MELLVVVSIIVLLLAMLMPAMNKAIYNARLAECGGKLKSIGAAVLTYAMENQRNYPDRGLEPVEPGSTLLGGWINPHALARPGHDWDNRPVLRTFLVINTQLQCPFNIYVELDDTPPDHTSGASYNMFWGWKYHTSSKRYYGMDRLDDPFEWESGAYRILAGDIDLKYPEGAFASHPDHAPSVLYPFGGESIFAFGRFGNGSMHLAGRHDRGTLDNNFLFDDGSVHRYQDVPNMDGLFRNVNAKSKDERFGIVPVQYDNQRDRDLIQIPRR